MVTVRKEDVVKIEKNIPIPEVRIGRPRKYDFDALGVGDSVNLELTYQAAHTMVGRVRKRKPEWSFTIKHDKKTGKTRVWRTA